MAHRAGVCTAYYHLVVLATSSVRAKDGLVRCCKFAHICGESLVHDALALSDSCPSRRNPSSSFPIRRSRDDRKRLNTCVVRIMLMVPIYAATSWLGLRFPDAAPHLRMLRECYEALALYSFFLMLILSLGGDEVVDDVRIPRRGCDSAPGAFFSFFFFLPFFCVCRPHIREILSRCRAR